MTIDERLENVASDLKRSGREIQVLKLAAQRDGENILALLRVAESRDRKLP